MGSQGPTIRNSEYSVAVDPEIKGEMFVTNPRAHALISNIKAFEETPSVRAQIMSREIDQVKQLVDMGVMTEAEAIEKLGLLKLDQQRITGETDDVLRDRVARMEALSSYEDTAKSPQQDFQDELEKL